MAENHRTFWAPHWLWQQYADVVGDIGRTADVETFIAWSIDNPGAELGSDVASPYDHLVKIRIHPDLWKLFMAGGGVDEGSSRIRSYIWWRVQNPNSPLPGRRTPPLQRWSRRLACV